MQNIQAVISLCIQLMNTKLNFGSVSFTFMQFWIAQIALIVVIWTVRNLFDS